MFDFDRYNTEILKDKKHELAVVENRIKKLLGIPEPFSLYSELISRQALKKGICIESFSLQWLKNQSEMDPIFGIILEWKN